MKKRFLISIAVVIALAAILIFGSDSRNIANYPSKNSGVIAFGDSLVEGVGSTSGGGFVTLLEESLDIEIANLGRSGDTTMTALARVSRVTERKPALTIVLLGGNDFLQRVSREATIKNLENIITAIQASGSAVLLIGLDVGIIGSDEGKIFEELALKYRTAYVPDVLDGIYGNKNLMADMLHPNDAGYEFVASRVLPVLKKLVR